jgi:ATP-dependent DNA ligase
VSEGCPQVIGTAPERTGKCARANATSRRGLPCVAIRHGAAAQSPVLHLDGEAGVCCPNAVAIFDGLHRRGTVTETMPHTFDMFEFDGEDLRQLALIERKVSTRSQDGVGAIVSKRLSAPYRPGLSRDWIKVKTIPMHPRCGGPKEIE